MRVDGETGSSTLDQALLDRVGAALLVLDENGVVVEANAEAEALFALSRQELIGARSPAGTPAPLTELGRRWEEDVRVRRPDGSVLVLHTVSSPIRETDGGLRGAVQASFDITARSRAERHLAAEHAVASVLSEVDTVAEAGPRIVEAVCRALDWAVGGFWEVDPEGEVLSCVDVWTSPGTAAREFEARTRGMVFGPGEGLPGRVWLTGRPEWVSDVAEDDNLPRAASAVRADLHRALAAPVVAGGAVVAVMEFFGREVEPPDRPLLDLMATLGSQIGHFVERKRAEEATRASEARKSAILESALDCIISMDHEGRITEFNPTAEHTFGYRREQVLGRPLAEVVVPPSLREAHRRGLARYLETGQERVLGRRVDITGMRSDGSEIPVELAISRVALPGPPIFTGYLRDITERRRAELELRQSRERFADLARTLQRSLLPAHLPDVPGVRLAAWYHPALAGLEVGGDFYDVFETGGDWAVVIGDVCGKGAEAAALTALIRYTVRAAAMQARSPATILRILNEAILRQQGDERFCTVAYARLVPAAHGVRVTVSSAGHPLPLVVRAGGEVRRLGAPGGILGVFPDVRLLEETTELSPGEVLVFYTDGITEAQGEKGLFGEEGLVAALVTAAGAGADVVARTVLESVRSFQGERQRDDMALLTVAVPAAGAGAGL